MICTVEKVLLVVVESLLNKVVLPLNAETINKKYQALRRTNTVSCLPEYNTASKNYHGKK